MADIYEYKDISEKAKQHAIEKLNENPSQVNNDIDNLRRWVKSMPHLTCPTDSKFLLRFLRMGKFNHEKARQLLDNFCTIRSSPKGSPQLFDYKTIDEGMIEEFLDSRIMTPLGRNEDGDFIFLMTTKNYDPETIPVYQWGTLVYLCIEVILEEEESQIYGTELFIDLTGTPMKLIKTWSDPTFLKNALRVAQDYCPWRLKSLIFYNDQKIFDIFFTIVTWFLNNKLKKRLLRLNKDQPDGLENIRGLKDLLPSEYGGHGGSWDSLTESWKRKFKSHYYKGYPFSTIHVDESKRCPKMSNYLVEYPKYDGPLYDS